MEILLELADEEILPEDYNGYIILGNRLINAIQWCNENGKQYNVIPENWTDRMKAKHANQHLNRIKKAMIEYATEILNDYHKTGYSSSAWNILLGPWMHHFLSSFYDKYLKLKAFEKMGISAEVSCYSTNDLNVCLDYLDYIELGFHEDEFHRYQYSMLLFEIGRVEKLRIKYKGTYIRPEIRYRSGTIPSYIKADENLRKKYKKEHNIHDDVVITSGYIKWDLYQEIMEQKPYRISGYFLNYFNDIRKYINTEIDDTWRNQYKVGGKIFDGFTDVAMKLLRKELPIAYVEGFEKLYKITRENYEYGYRAKAIVYDASGVIDNEMHKLFLMDMEGKNKKGVDIQHGGGYGMWMDWGYKYEYDVSDEFLTSGWSKKDRYGKIFSPMPFIKFFRMKQYNIPENERILYVSYCASKNVFRLSFLELGIEKFLDDEIRFLKQLDDEIKRKLYVRLHPDDYGWKQRERINKEINLLKYDEEEDYYKSLATANLVVCMFFSTTTMEALYWDKPILVLNHPFARSIEDEKSLELEIEALVDVGIIARTPGELADTLNCIGNDIPKWWNEPKRKRVVNNIKEKYIFFPTNAKKMWIDKMNSLSK